ncbi:MAG: protein-L-isoaspartate(D-aspartate) O-methyltransferase [Chloroflexota bacterium]
MYRARWMMLLLFLAACRAVSHPPPITPPPPTQTSVPTLAVTPSPIPQEDPFAALRQQMVDTCIAAQGVTDERVLAAMRAAPRHLFVPSDLVPRAYQDRALPIGYGQTISQPYIVALMTQLLDLTPGDRVLEIGTGSGYQAAVLAHIPDVEVYTIEIVPELAERTDTLLHRLGYDTIQRKQGDGYFGWPEYAPFDAVIVTAAPDHLPQPLVEQLTDDGRLVIPIGPPGGFQTLWKFVKQPDGELKAYNQGGVIFVPFTGQGVETHDDSGP